MLHAAQLQRCGVGRIATGGQEGATSGVQTLCHDPSRAPLPKDAKNAAGGGNGCCGSGCGSFVARMATGSERRISQPVARNKLSDASNAKLSS